MEEFDVNKAAAEYVTQNSEKIYNFGKNIIKDAKDKLRLHLDRTYKTYLATVGKKYSEIKSFFIRDQPVPLYSMYVPIGVHHSKKNIESPTITDITSINQFIIITGVAATGKSMLMRHLFLNSILMKKGVPILIELRDLNETNDSLTDLIYHTLELNHFDFGQEYSEKALKEGHFILFLDGLDEVSEAKSKKVKKEIKELAKVYDETAIIVSSRPETEYGGWESFSVLQINPLTLELACELLNKLTFDEAIKSKLIDDLNKGLFEKHQSFLSNPLLLSIMLLTYELSPTIPGKLSIFYDLAFEALFQRHDAYKGGFQRKRATDLDIQDFAKTFSAFSLITYDKRLFKFSHLQAKEFLDQAKKIVSTSKVFDSDCYLTDTLKSVCLLIEDGILLSYIHRSFQEYFTALFIRNANSDVQKKLIKKYIKSVMSDNIFHLLYELNPEVIEMEYILPEIERLQKVIKLKKKLGLSHLLNFLKYTSSVIRVDSGDFQYSGKSSTSDFSLFSLIQFCALHCNHLVDWDTSPTLGKDLLDSYNLTTNTAHRSIAIEVSTMTTKHPLLKVLAQSNAITSISQLECIFKLKEVLLKKHQQAEISLAEIFGK